MKENFLKIEPVNKLLLRLSLPMVLSMLVNSIYNIVDSIYLARLGTDAITALSIIFPIQNLTVAVSVGLGVGLSSLISRLVGGGRQNEAEEAATQGLVLTLINGIIFIVLGAFFIQYYVSFYAASRTFTYATDYGRIILCFSLPYLIYLVFEKIFQSLGWMKTVMVGMFVGSISNIILDPVFIFGYAFIPPMGVKGAAIATVIGQTVALIFFFTVYLFSDFPIRFSKKHIWLKWEYVKNIYNVGIPATVSIVLPSVLISVLNSLLVSISQDAVAVLGIYYKIQTFFYLPMSGFTMGLRPIIGFNYGAGDYTRVKEAFFQALKVGFMLLGFGFILLEIFPDPVMALFKPSAQLNELAVRAFRIIAIGFIPSVVTVILNDTFAALGWGKDSFILSILRQIVLVIPIACIFRVFFGVDGVFWSIPIAEILTAFYSFYMIQNKLMPKLN